MASVIAISAMLTLTVASLGQEPTVEPNAAMERYSRMSREGEALCFDRLSKKPVALAATLLVDGISGRDLCRCVGEMFATSFVSVSLDGSQLKAMNEPTDGSPPLFDSYALVCVKRLIPKR